LPRTFILLRIALNNVALSLNFVLKQVGWANRAVHRQSESIEQLSAFIVYLFLSGVSIATSRKLIVLTKMNKFDL